METNSKIIHTIVNFLDKYFVIPIIIFWMAGWSSYQREKTLKRTPLFTAIKKKKIKAMQYILKNNKIFVNRPFVVMGNLAGYTALHVACMGNNPKMVESLIQDYQADITLIADDGAEPIHLASLFGDSEAVKILLDAGANVNAKLERSLHLKYKNEAWCDDFGDKMTILTYAVLCNNCRLANILIEENADVTLKGRKNKILLMYALEYKFGLMAILLLTKTNREILIARDDEGLTAFHYLFHSNQRDFNERFEFRDTITELLLYAGVDVNATVNNDPSTLILNIAAYRNSSDLLSQLLPHYFYITKSKALYYAALPLENLDTDGNEENQWLQEWNEIQRRNCIEVIIKDLVNRRTFGLPVPEEEKQLMDKLIATDENVRAVVRNHQRDFIHGTLKNEVICYEDKKITHYDFIRKNCSDRRLRLLVRNQNLFDAFNAKMDFSSVNYKLFYKLLNLRVARTWRRVRLLEDLKGVQELRKALPLQYELVLEIVDYLDNCDLENFIKAFYNN